MAIQRTGLRRPYGRTSRSRPLRRPRPGGPECPQTCPQRCPRSVPRAMTWENDGKKFLRGDHLGTPLVTFVGTPVWRDGVMTTTSKTSDLTAAEVWPLLEQLAT